MPLYNQGPVYFSNTALVAQTPDSTTAGGNARGANAVDLQTTRTAATNVASGTNAVIGGGSSNTASGPNSVVAGGTFNTANASGASVLGGQACTASGSYSTAYGQYASTRGIYGRVAFSSNRIAATGDAQSGEHLLLIQTADATPTRATADKAAAGTTNTINMPDFSNYTGTMYIVAKAAGSTDSACWQLPITAVRGSGVASVVMYQAAAAAAPTASNGAGAAAYRVTVAADTTNGGMSVTVTGAAATTVNWSVRYVGVEVATSS